MPKSIREALEETFDVGEETGRPEEDPKEPVGSPGETEEVEPQEKPELEDEEAPAKEVPEEPEEKPKKESAPPPPEDDIKAPESWKPAIREHWKGIPKEVKEEISRRETEISRALQRASGHRKLADEYANLIRPYEKYIRLANSTPFQAVDNMLRTAAHLADGTPTQKAQVIRDIIKNYDVDIGILDSVLAGEELPGSANDSVIQAMEKRFAPMLKFFEEAQGNQKSYQESQSAKIEREIEEFSNDKSHEFYSDVRETMADLIEVAERRGLTMTLQEAYDKACQLTPDIAKIVSQRSMAVTEEKKRAASSIPGNSPNSEKKGGSAKDLRSALADAWDDATVT